MPDVRRACPRAIDARERENSARCDPNRDAARAAKNRRAAALRTALVMTFAIAATAACATPPEPGTAQPSGQPACNVAGKFCNTFFGP
ncbi:hypothetical protein FSB08_18695 [Paraburkholderia sp. JPY432]|nr:hypothetical protein [Paraburkholderia youngii]